MFAAQLAQSSRKQGCTPGRDTSQRNEGPSYDTGTKDGYTVPQSSDDFTLSTHLNYSPSTFTAPCRNMGLLVAPLRTHLSCSSGRASPEANSLGTTPHFGSGSTSFIPAGPSFDAIAPDGLSRSSGPNCMNRLRQPDCMNRLTEPDCFNAMPTRDNLNRLSSSDLWQHHQVCMHDCAACSCFMPLPG
jgi:hypothetical protein